ncbi:MAG: hypothetical protein K2P58_07415 [Hyphomonadaceae bacterium]|nr:hypothetical protein [Hyphomonadaceae bacterium]
MTTMRQWCRWSTRALDARPIFTGLEIKAINREAKRKIKDFFAVGEGYHTSSIPFVLFACGFILIYAFEEECWILDIVSMPPDGPYDPNRKRRRRQKGYERVIEAIFEGLRQALGDGVGAAGALLYNTARTIGPRIAVFWRNIDGRQGWADDMERPALTDSEPMPSRSGHASGVYVQVVQLVRARVSTSLTFLGSIWVLQPEHCARGDKQWDISLFGPLPEQVST